MLTLVYTARFLPLLHFQVCIPMQTILCIPLGFLEGIFFRSPYVPSRFCFCDFAFPLHRVLVELLLVYLPVPSTAWVVEDCFTEMSYRMQNYRGTLIDSSISRRVNVNVIFFFLYFPKTFTGDNSSDVNCIC